MNLLASPWTGQALAALLAVCSLATLTVILATFSALRPGRQAPASLANELKRLFREEMWGQARLLCEGDDRLLCHVARDIIDARESGAAERARSRAMDRAAALWQTRLGVLSHLSRLGVVLGLLASTRGLALALSAAPADLGARLAAALGPLAAGLAIALAACAAQAVFHVACARMLDRVDRGAGELVALLAPESGQEDEP